MKMGWNYAVLVYLIVSLFVAQGSTVQYINTNFRGNCPCQNVPIQRNLPIRLPISANLPIANNWETNMPLNAAIPLPNAGCPCNRNNAPIFNDRINLSPQERSSLIANLKMVLSNLLPIAEKLALLSNLALATRNAAENLNVPMRKLNVPIVNDVPFGALRVARNLPMSNFLTENSPIGVSNNIQVLGKGPINYQNLAGIPLNNIAQMTLSNIRNVPVNNILNGVSNLPFNPGYSVNNVINKNIDRHSILSRPPCSNVPLPTNNIPCNNMPRMTLNDILNKIQSANNLNLPVNNMALPINNHNFRVNTVASPINYNLPVQNSIRYINTASPSVVNDRFAYEQLPLASSNNGRVLTNVPVIPYNSLANLPAYNGLPVIKVSESVYRLTPVDNML